MLYLCANQALLKAVKICVGQVGKATLVAAPDADILLKAIEERRKRTTAGAATFLFKVTAHRGEPANEEGITSPKFQKNDLVLGVHGRAGSWRGQ